MQHIHHSEINNFLGRNYLFHLKTLIKVLFTGQYHTSYKEQIDYNMVRSTTIILYRYYLFYNNQCQGGRER